MRNGWRGCSATAHTADRHREHCKAAPYPFSLYDHLANLARLIFKPPLEWRTGLPNYRAKCKPARKKVVT